MKKFLKRSFFHSDGVADHGVVHDRDVALRNALSCRPQLHLRQRCRGGDFGKQICIKMKHGS